MNEQQKLKAEQQRAEQLANRDLPEGHTLFVCVYLNRLLSEGNTPTEAIEKLENDFGIGHRHSNIDGVDFYVFNYSQIDSPKFCTIVNDARSLVLTLIGGVFVEDSLSFTRFYNLGEDPKEGVDFSRTYWYPKHDGSLVTAWFSKSIGRPLYRTKSMIMPDESMKTTVDGLPWKTLIESTLQWEELKELLVEDMNYTFEVCSPHNRIVYPYDKPQAYFLAAITEDSNCYLNGIHDCIRDFKEELEKLGIEVLPMSKFSDEEAMNSAMAEQPPLFEGYVGYVSDLGMYYPVAKSKSKAYVAAHRMRGEGLNPKRICQLVIANEQDEYISVFPEDESVIIPYVDAYESVKDQLEKAIALGVGIFNEEGNGYKEVALAFKDTPWQGFVMNHIRKGAAEIDIKKVLTSIREPHMIDLIKNNLAR
ncbi:hypothetical protein [Pseudoalteromonas phage J2-1_QLiu-2017]|nr:hypothetical protein [Pseudoalteromonas phage J2-1_QLiu-2017]